MSKEEIIAHIQRCAEKLGRPPVMGELLRDMKITQDALKKTFGTFTQALKKCGLKRRGTGHPLTTEALFTDWVGIVRKLKKFPKTSEYAVHSQYSTGPLSSRFGKWNEIPLALLRFAEKNSLQAQWKDVLERIRVYKQDLEARRETTSEASAPAEKRKWRRMHGRPTYGPILARGSLIHGPADEAGVIYLFGALAAQLGFVVTRIQSDYPDCEAMRRVDDDRWQSVRIEFEYESRNFVRHKHDPSQCDLIVCWKHNWPECPCEVVELREEIALLP